jgi:Predicted membrane protein
MKRLLHILLTVAVASAILVACKHNSDNPVPANPGDTTNNGGGNGGNNGGTNPQDTALCFQRDVLPIFVANCAKSGCHDAISRQDGFQFTDYESVIRKEFVSGNANATELFEKITESDDDKRMPPAPSPRLTAQQIALIGRWINEGAQNRGNCGTLCDTSSFTYSGAVKAITEQYCRGCHSSASPSGGVVLDTYAGVKTVADNGRLAGAINHRAGFKPMPQGGAKLSDCQIKQIEKWIASGAPDN